MDPTRPAPPPEPDAAPLDDPAQPGRRDFFMAMGRDAVRSAGQLAGALSAISNAPLNLGSDLLGLTSTQPTLIAHEQSTPTGVEAASGTTLGNSVASPRQDGRRPWRLDGTTLCVLDQRDLPGAPREIRCDSAAAVAASLGSLATPFGPALGEIAAQGLVLAAREAIRRPAEDRARFLRWNLSLLRGARPSSAATTVALARTEARLQVMPPGVDGPTIVDALAEDAQAFASEVAAGCRALSEAGAAALAGDPTAPFEVVTLGASGPLSGGGCGTAFALIAELARLLPRLHVWLAESRPTLVGARIGAHELANQGLPLTMLADGSLGELLRQRPIDLAVVAAERIARNGDVHAIAGTYALAVLLARHGVPLLVAAPLWTIDDTIADAASLPSPQRPNHELMTLAGQRITAGGSDAYVPLLDVTPADLVSGIASELGVLRAGGWPRPAI